MSKSSQEAHHKSSNDFSPKSFVIFCLEDESNIAFEASWGETPEDIKNFAILLNKINNGEFAKLILDQLKLQSKKETNGIKNFNMFNKVYRELQKPIDLVVDPTEVELN